MIKIEEKRWRCLVIQFKNFVFWLFPLLPLLLERNFCGVFSESLQTMAMFINEQLISLIFVLLTVSFASLINFVFQTARIMVSNETRPEKKEILVVALTEARKKMVSMTVLAFLIPLTIFFTPLLGVVLPIQNLPFILLVSFAFWFFWMLVDLSFAQLTLAQIEIKLHSE